MILSLIVYGLLLLIMCALVVKSHKTDRFKYAVYAALVFGVVFGVRYGVGRDFPAYLINYKSYLNNGYANIEDEIGFSLLQLCFAKCKLHPIFFMGFISFTEILLCYLALRNRKFLLLPFTVVFFLTATWLPFSSALRQSLAFGFFLLSLEFIGDKRWWMYFVLVLLAYSIHKSALLLFLVYPLLYMKLEWFTNIKIQVIVYLSSIICMVTHALRYLIESLELYINIIAMFMSYDHYLDNQYTDVVYQEEEGIGLGQLVYIFLFLSYILYSNKVKKYFNDEFLTRSYNLFYVGVVLKFLFNGSNLFSRFNWYFEYFYLIIGAYVLIYLYKLDKTKYNILLAFNILIIAAVFLKGDINFANYYFFWQEDEFMKDHRGMFILTE